MKKYEKPYIEDERISVEDIVCISSGKETVNGDVASIDDLVWGDWE